MKEFLLLFRMDITSPEAQPTDEQMEIYMEQWMEWIDEIADNEQLGEGGHHLSRQGRVITSNHEVIEKPHIADNTSVAGYILVLAQSMEEATAIAQKCPILNGSNTSVEIRETATPGE